MPPITSVSHAVNAVLSKIGADGKTKYEPTAPRGENDKPLWLRKAETLHRMFVCDIIRSYGEKGYKAARKEAGELGLLDGLEDIEQGEERSLTTHGRYMVFVRCNKAATKLDATKLLSKLSIKLGAKEALRLIEECTEETKPARIVKLIEVGDRGGAE